MTDDEVLGLELLARSIADREAPVGHHTTDSTLGTLDAFLQRQLGHRLVTVLRIEDDLLWSARIYSSQGGHLATQARKCLDDAPQMRKVIAARKPLLVDGEPAVRAAFSDHERILSLGCASVRNIPILIAGTPKANVNLLHVAGHFAGPSQARNIRMAHIACQMCAPLYTSP